jgi:glycosyltransferase A (GT-A) superfamily protein (DUF2064 family)
VTALIVAKAPVPGLAKTRLAAALGDRVAAGIAAAALLDTLDAVADTHLAAKVVAMTGDLASACQSEAIRERLSGFTVVEQRGDSFADRLANAHADAAATAGPMPVLQIGMDTPQVTAELLTRCARALLGAHAVVGPARDGGWWLLGVADAATAECLRLVPMSRPDTGALTYAALLQTGSPVIVLQELADVDTVADISVVRADCRPSGRFAQITTSVQC